MRKVDRTDLYDHRLPPTSEITESSSAAQAGRRPALAAHCPVLTRHAGPTGDALIAAARLPIGIPLPPPVRFLARLGDYAVFTPEHERTATIGGARPPQHLAGNASVTLSAPTADKCPQSERCFPEVRHP